MFAEKAECVFGELGGRRALTALVAIQVLFVVAFLALPLKLFLLLTALIFCALIIIIRPEWAAYLLIFSVPLFANYAGFYLKPTGIGALSSKPIPVFLPFLLFGALGFLMKRSAQLCEGVRRPDPWTIPMVLITVYAFISLSWAPYKEYGLATVLVVIVNFVLYSFFVAIVRDSAFHRRLMLCWISAGVVSALLVVLSFYGIPAQKFYSARITDTVLFTYNNFTRFVYRGHALGHPNVAATILNMTIPINIGLLLLEKTRWKRVLLSCALIFMIACNFLTLSKAGLGAFIVMVCFLVAAISQLRRKLFVNLVASIAAVVLIFAVSLVYYNNTINRDKPFRLFTMSTRGGEEITSLRHRIEMWKAGWAQMETRELMFSGLGPGNFEKTTHYPHAHNFYFSFFFDLGVAGVIFECIILFALVKFIWKFFRKHFIRQSSYFQVMTVCFIGGLLALSIHSTVDQYYYKHVIWIFLGLAMATFGLMEQESAESEKGSEFRGTD